MSWRAVPFNSIVGSAARYNNSLSFGVRGHQRQMRCIFCKKFPALLLQQLKASVRRLTILESVQLQRDINPIHLSISLTSQESCSAYLSNF